MTIKSKKLLLLVLFVFLFQTIAGTISVYADNIQQIGSGYYILSQKKTSDFSDGNVTGNTNNIGYFKTDTIDETHGLSAVFGADENADITKEGAWIALSGNTGLQRLVFDFDFYSDGIDEGIIKFMLRTKKGSSNVPVYFMGLDKNGILFDNDSNSYKFEGDETTRVPYTFCQWHKFRLFVDMSDFSYEFYMDDMTVALAQGKIDVSGISGIDSLRIIMMEKDTFAAADNYTLYGVSDVEAGYTPPILSLRQIGNKITEDEEGEIVADISSTTEISSVSFFVNDDMVFTDTEAPFALTYLFDAGEYSLKAVARDKYGQTGESEELVVVSHKSTIPAISINLSDGEEVDKAKLENIEITLDMSDVEIKTAYISIDGETAKELKPDKNTLNLSYLSIGFHNITVYVENILSETKEKSFTIEVIKKYEDTVYSDDYEAFTGADGILGSNNIGYRSGEILRDDFGYSAVIGADGDVDTSKEGAWLGITLSKCSSVAEVSFDWYFSALRGSAVAQLRTTSAVIKPLFTITSSQVSSSDGKQKYSFSADHWYKVKLTIDAVKKTYSLYLDDNGAIINQPIDYPEGSIFDSIRLVSKLSGNPKTFFAVDNMSVRHLLYAPMITSVSSKNSFADNVVLSADKEIFVYFSGGLEKTSIYPSKFLITSEDETIAVTDAEYDANGLFVKLGTADNFKAGKKYRITVLENVVMSNGELYGEKLYFDFTAERSVFEADNISLSADGVVTINVTNKSSESKSFYLLTNIYENGYVIKKSVKEIPVSAGTSIVTEPIDGYTRSNTADIMLWDNLDTPYCFSYAEY